MCNTCVNPDRDKNKTIVFYDSGMGFDVKTYFGGLHDEQTNCRRFSD